MLLDMILGQLGGEATQVMSRKIGATPQATGHALSQALPLLLGALANNSSQPAGAEALSAALQKDHDGSILDNLTGFLSGGATGPGDGILRHVLGDRRQPVEAALSQSSGLSVENAGTLLSMLAPVVMGVLGKTRQEQGLDTSSLASLLMGAKSGVASSPAAGLLSLLDSDKDGSVLDDVGGLLGKFLK